MSGSNTINKQQTARYLAQKANVDIYRIDLSAVVVENLEKTQKNINSIFEAAKNKNWVLFFDEAEALFGKRTSVSNSHHRYDSTGTAYFIKQVASYRNSIIISIKKPGDINPVVFENYVKFAIH